MSTSPVVRRRSLFASVVALLISLAACSEPTAPPKVVGIILIPLQDTLTVGETSQIAANVLGESGSTLSGARVEWASSNTSVATVSNSGLVTAVGAGTATISATAGGITRTGTVVVRPPSCGAPSGTALTIGASRSGNMGSNSCLLWSFYTAVGYPLSVSSNGGVRLNIIATGFSPGIYLIDSNGNLIAASDPGGSNPSLRPVLDAGNYQVWVVSTAVASASHAFTLTASEAGGRCENGVEVTRTLDMGSSAAAAVTDLSCVLLGGPAAEGWRIQLDEPTSIRVTATSAAFPPTVVITPTDYSEVISYFIANQPGNATAQAVLPAGEYLVWGGSFDLLNGTVQVAVEVAAPCAPSGALTLGAAVNGVLAATDCSALGNSAAYADVWTFTLGATTSVRFDQNSTAFDTYLELRDASDFLIAEDDDGGEGTNSRLIRTLSPGTYRVWASSYFSAVTGAYTLEALTPGGALQMERAQSEAVGASSPSGKPQRPATRPWPAPRSDGTHRK